MNNTYIICVVLVVSCYTVVALTLSFICSTLATVMMHEANTCFLCGYWTILPPNIHVWHQCFSPSIKFKAKWSYKSVTFLNTKFTNDDEGRSNTDLYVKQTDTHQYPHRSSCHPGHCKCGIPYSQALRRPRIYSRTENYRISSIKRWLLINAGPLIHAGRLYVHK